MKYRVIGGVYNDGEDSYPVGSVVDSDSPLDEKFAGCLERIHEEPTAIVPTTVAKPETAALPTVAPQVPEPEAEAAEESSSPEHKPPSARSRKARKGAVRRGKNVTEQFQSAVDADCKVFRLGKGRFQIFDNDSPDVPLNASPVSKAKVESVIADHFGG